MSGAAHAGAAELGRVEVQIGFAEPGWQRVRIGQTAEQIIIRSLRRQRRQVRLARAHDQKLLQRRADVALELGFRHTRLLEVELVEKLPFEQLAHGRHRLHRESGVRTAQTAHHRGDLLRMVERRAPGGGRAPVVAEDHGGFVTERRNQAHDVGDHFHLVVGLDRFRPVALAVAAHVRRHGVVAGRRQRRELMAPGVPGLRESRAA